MYALLNSFGLSGLQGFGVAVEADVSSGMDGFTLVGLPDTAVRESADRIRAAARNLKYRWPSGRVTANLARSEEHTSELQSRFDLVCRLLLEQIKLISDY